MSKAITDRNSIIDAYEEVRSDKSDTSWAVLKYDNKNIILEATGVEYEEFVGHFTDDERKYGFVRVTTGDELSKRAKFVFITWCGNDVSAMKKARMSTDKSEVKDIMSSFAIELLVCEQEELAEKQIMEEVRKAGGANYGTGN